MARVIDPIIKRMIQAGEQEQAFLALDSKKVKHLSAFVEGVPMTKVRYALKQFDPFEVQDYISRITKAVYEFVVTHDATYGDEFFEQWEYTMDWLPLDVHRAMTMLSLLEDGALYCPACGIVFNEEDHAEEYPDHELEVIDPSDTGMWWAADDFLDEVAPPTRVPLYYQYKPGFYAGDLFILESLAGLLETLNSPADFWEWLGAVNETLSQLHNGGSLLDDYAPDVDEMTGVCRAEGIENALGFAELFYTYYTLDTH